MYLSIVMNLFKQQMCFFMIAFASVILSILVNNSFTVHSDLFNHLPYYFIRYFFSAILSLAILNFIYFLTNKFKFTICVFFTLFTLLNFINIEKQKYLSATLTPNDFLLFQETIIAAPKILLVGFIIILLILIYFLYKINKSEVSLISNYRFHNLILATIISSVFIFLSSKENFSPYCEKLITFSLNCKFAAALPKTRNNWLGDHEIIKSHGYITFFISKSIDSYFESRPAFQVSEEKILPLFNLRINQNNNPLPNIVFVMSEAHWNAAQLDKSIPQNITPTINKNQISTLLSPSFGGGTANVEFEVLTSLNTYLNHNELAYTSKLKRPTYSLPMYLNTLGYETTAMHNNGKYFYNRDTVYKNIGFNRFISIENMVNSADKAKYMNSAGWATDDLIYDSIYNQIKNTDKPQFIYAISVESHGTYNDDRFGKNNFQISKAGISDLSKQTLNTYLTGMERTDKRFNTLLQNVKQLDRPTIVIFFGDHLPALQTVYDEYGFFKSEQDKTEKKDVRFFETPLAVWANFPIDKKQFDGQFVAAHFLAPKVLEAAHVPLSPYYSFVNKVSSCYKAVHQTGTQPQKSCEFNQADVLKQYQDMNMDVLNGKNFTYQILQPKTEG